MSDKRPPEKPKAPYVQHDYRVEAELLLAKPPVRNLTTADTILHELQVHQIELEMQNEQLRQAHVALEESRDRYVDLFEFAPIGYLTLTDKGLIAEVNFIGAELLGTERKKLLLQPFSRYIAPEYSDQFNLRLVRLMQNEAQQSYDMQIRRDDDTKSYVHVDALHVKAEDGTVTFRITLTDITKSKRIEEALKESEQRLNFAFKGSGDGMWDWDVNTGQVHYSKQWKSMLGFSDEEFKSEFKAWEDHVHPDDLKQSLADIQAYLAGKTPSYSNQHRLQCKNGTYKWILSRGIVVSRNDDGKPKRLIGTHTDITAQKLVEQDLRIAATAFEGQEGIMVTDSHNIIIRVNQAFSRITGYGVAEMIGKKAGLLKSSQHDAAFFKAMFETIGREQFWQGEIWNQRKSGEIFPCFMMVTAVIDAEGRTTNYVGSFLDITVQKQAEKVLLEDKKRLEKKVKNTEAELTAVKGETEDVNTALKVMIKMRRTENFDAKSLLSQEVKLEVMPFLHRLKSGNQDLKQIRIINTLEANLQRLIETYGNPTSISSAYSSLTPKEIQVATMVREGFSTKVIAATLSLSPETISIHRKKIRKKLGLDSQSDNLRSYLITFDQ